jgi:hypothetical protein
MTPKQLLLLVGKLAQKSADLELNIVIRDSKITNKAFSYFFLSSSVFILDVTDTNAKAGFFNLKICFSLFLVLLTPDDYVARSPR